jgi:hypothetical protein
MGKRPRKRAGLRGLPTQAFGAEAELLFILEFGIVGNGYLTAMTVVRSRSRKQFGNQSAKKSG